MKNNALFALLTVSFILFGGSCSQRYGYISKVKSKGKDSENNTVRIQKSRTIQESTLPDYNAKTSEPENVQANELFSLNTPAGAEFSALKEAKSQTVVVKRSKFAPKIFNPYKNLKLKSIKYNFSQSDVMASNTAGMQFIKKIVFSILLSVGTILLLIGLVFSIENVTIAGIVLLGAWLLLHIVKWIL